MRKLAISFALLTTLAWGQTASKPLSIVVSPADVTITTVSLAAGKIGTGYSQSLTATGGTLPYTWSITAGALPAGLTLSANGAITGTPTSIGTANFTVTVKDATAIAHSVDVKWNASTTPGVTTTNVYRDGVKIGMVLMPDSLFHDTAVQSGRSYVYKVSSFNGVEGPQSAGKTAVVP